MADLTQTQGSLTIVDFNDAPMLQASIDVITGAPTQVYVSDLSDYSAGNDWSTVNLKLVPRLYRSGTPPVNVVTETDDEVTVTWHQNFSGSWTEITNGGNYSLANNGRDSLTVTGNVLGFKTKQGKIKAEITYQDPLTFLSTTGVALFDVNVIGTQLGSVALILTTDTGLTFKNGSTDSNQSISITAELLRGSTPDTTDLVYTWYQDGDVIAGEVSSTLTRVPDDIFSKAVISCTVSDTALGDSYTNSVQILDVTDPIQVNIVSNIGNIFKVGAGNTARLTANLYRNGSPISSPTSAGYVWALLDKSGAPVSWATGGGVPNISRSGTGVSGDNFVTIPNVAALKVGYDAEGSNIPSGAKINRIDGTKVYLTESLIANGTSYTFGLDSHEKLSAPLQTYVDVSHNDISVRGTVVAKVLF